MKIFCEHRECIRHDYKYLLNYLRLDSFKYNEWKVVDIKSCVSNNYEMYKK